MQLISIGIQARLNSTRLPRKILKQINSKRVLDYVLDAAFKTKKYINRHSHRNGMEVKIHLLIPEGDEIHVPRGVEVIKGSEEDVLSRYAKIVQDEEVNYVVRITSDCPLVPYALINKAITVAIKGDFDFVTNASPLVRTFWDGSDIEVVSARLLRWMDMAFSCPNFREHVTLGLHTEFPKWASRAHIFSDIDLSTLKLSIDTLEDIERVGRMLESVTSKIHHWEMENGPNTTYKF